MFRGFRRWLGWVVLCLLVTGCDLPQSFRPKPPGAVPPGPKQPLIVGLLADPVFQRTVPNSEGMNGFSRDLVEAFADKLGVEVRYVETQNTAALLDLVRSRQVHMAVDVPVLRGESALTYSPPLHETRQLIVQPTSALPVDSLAKLAERDIVMLPGAPQARTLAALAIQPAPVLRELEGINEIDLLAGVAQRRYDLVATDELHFDIASNYYPDIEIAYALPEKIAYVWAFPLGDPDFNDRAICFIESAQENGTLRRLTDRYFGHIKQLDAQDIQVFLGHVRGRLNDYRRYFLEAQEITGIDWRLLAALSYQESKFDPLATSPTGVRGIMMLTEETADRLGVANRLDARESILAGAEYLASLKDELPDEIKNPDRLWFALAAYNLGMGHLRGGRLFAPGLKRDPNLWVDMKEVLPLLARPEYYERLKSGRARGGEAVVLVENIRNYYDVLSRFEPVYTPPSLHGDDKPRRDRKRKPPQRLASTSTPPM